MKKYLLPVIAVVVIVVVLFLIICPKGGGCRKNFNKKIAQLAQDSIINDGEWDELKKYVLKCKDLGSLANDDSLNAYITKVMVGKSVDICCPAEKIQADNIHFYLESSESMSGYIKGGQTFRDVVIRLTSIIEDYYCPGAPACNKMHVYTIDEAGSKEYPLKEFNTKLSNKTLAAGKSSPLNSIFESIIKLSSTDDLVFMVSDGIMCGSPDAIKRNSEWNIDNKSELRREIKMAFKLRKNLGVAILAFYSGFDGTYFNYKNKPTKMVFSRRPFYVWVIGNPELVLDFCKHKEVAQLPVEKELFIGVNRETVKDFGAFVSHRTDRNCKVKNGIDIQAEDNPSEGKPSIFSVGVNLSMLPLYAQELNYIRDNVVIEGASGIDVKFGEVYKSIDPRYEQEKQNKSRYTHFIEVIITGISQNNPEISLKLRNVPDTWYKDWSDERDVEVNAGYNRTFLFEDMVEGIRDAFKGSGQEAENYIDIKIKVVK